MPSSPAYVELSFRPSVSFISIVRRFVSEFCDGLSPNPDDAARVALATHELLENAVRYSVDGETRIRIELAPKERTIAIHTWNKTDEKNLTALHDLFEEMRREPDPFSFYTERMRRTADQEEGSGLGLARVLAEADMKLAYRVEDGSVCVTAASPVVAADRGTPDRRTEP